MGTSYNPKIITNGLILNLDAGNKKSYSGTGSNFYDIQKNKNIITLNNSPTFSSSNGGYLTFNGTTQYGLLSTPNLISANYNKTSGEGWPEESPETGASSHRVGGYSEHRLSRPTLFLASPLVRLRGQNLPVKIPDIFGGCRPLHPRVSYKNREFLSGSRPHKAGLKFVS